MLLFGQQLFSTAVLEVTSYAQWTRSVYNPDALLHMVTLLHACHTLQVGSVY